MSKPEACVENLEKWSHSGLKRRGTVNLKAQVSWAAWNKQIILSRFTLQPSQPPTKRAVMEGRERAADESEVIHSAFF